MTKVILLTAWCTLSIGIPLWQVITDSSTNVTKFWGRVLRTATWLGFIYWFCGG